MTSSSTIGSSSYLLLTGDHQLQVKFWTVDVDDVVGDGDVVGPIVVIFVGLEVVSDVEDWMGGPGKSSLLWESSSENGSFGGFSVDVSVMSGTEVVVNFDRFAIHWSQLRASYLEVTSFSSTKMRSVYLETWTLQTDN